MATEYWVSPRSKGQDAQDIWRRPGGVSNRQYSWLVAVEEEWSHHHLQAEKESREVVLRSWHRHASPVWLWGSFKKSWAQRKEQGQWTMTIVGGVGWVRDPGHTDKGLAPWTPLILTAPSHPHLQLAHDISIASGGFLQVSLRSEDFSGGITFFTQQASSIYVGAPHYFSPLPPRVSP